MDEMVTIEDKMNAITMADSEDPSDMAEKLEGFNDHLEDISKHQKVATTYDLYVPQQTSQERVYHVQ